MGPPEGFSLFKLFIGALSNAKNWLHRRLKKDDEIHQLCTFIAFALEDYAACCYSVSHDVGHQGPDGTWESRVAEPELDLQSLKPDWLLLSKNLRYRLIELPEKLKRIHSFLAASADHATPPDYDEYYFDRQDQYTTIGIEVGKLAEEVRKYARLPDDKTAGNLLVALVERRADLDREIRERERRAQDWQLHYDQVQASLPDDYCAMTAILQGGIGAPSCGEAAVDETDRGRVDGAFSRARQ